MGVQALTEDALSVSSVGKNVIIWGAFETEITWDFWLQHFEELLKLH